MERAGDHDAGGWPAPLQRAEAHDWRHLAADADADLARPGARRPRHAHRLSNHSAAGGLRTYRARPRTIRTGAGPRRLGADTSAGNHERAGEVRRRGRVNSPVIARPDRAIQHTRKPQCVLRHPIKSGDDNDGTEWFTTPSIP